MPHLLNPNLLTQVEPFLRALLIVILGYFCAHLLTTSLAKTLIKHMTPQQSMLLRRMLFYFVFALFVASAIQQLGFHISALLGAAGILTVAIGIASQTSMSNIISGLFMIGEKPFEVGHMVKVGELQGEILAIDLLSVKMRTPDNTLVRIPNETLIKSPIINLSWFPIRRADLKFSVDYQADLNHVKTILNKVATDNPFSLIEPKPSFLITGFGDTGIDLQFSVWSSRPNFNEMKNMLHMEIKIAFAKHNIEFPNRALAVEHTKEPLLVKLITTETD